MRALYSNLAALMVSLTPRFRFTQYVCIKLFKNVPRRGRLITS